MGRNVKCPWLGKTYLRVLECKRLKTRHTIDYNWLHFVQLRQSLLRWFVLKCSEGIPRLFIGGDAFRLPCQTCTKQLLLPLRPRHRSRVLVCMDVVLFFGSALVALKFWSLAEPKTVATFRHAKKVMKEQCWESGSTRRCEFETCDARVTIQMPWCHGLATAKMTWCHDCSYSNLFNSMHSDFLHFEVSSCLEHCN